ncbi:MAG TPA: SDR family oxidoreductase [Terrimesophilobacter sp.]|nr:SDR family oxidoreductase [Terrimesophilobacter sp.]
MTPAAPEAFADFLGISDRRILVTGASSGIGRATAILASRHGAKLALVGRRVDALSAVRGSLHGDGHLIYEFDLSDTDGIPSLVNRIAEDFGGLDSVVHAAGIHSARPLRAIDTDHLDLVLHSNVTTGFMLAKGFRNKRISKVRPSMVLVSSVMACVGQPGVSAYAASKGAVSAATKSLALELERDGIRVNCVEPGIVMTEMTETLKATVGEENFATINTAHPLGLGKPEDVANAIVYLLSDAASWVTGTSLVVDGGYTAQ